MKNMRFLTLGIVVCALGSVAAAAPRSAPPAAPDPMEALYACADKTSDPERLACFDAEVRRLRSAQLAGEFAAVDRLKAETLRREAFGFNLPSLPRFILPGANEAEEVSSASAVVASFSEGGRSFKLDNGQVWRITDSDPPPRQLKVGATVEITRAALGSFLMQVKGSSKGLRVKRTD